MIYVATKVSRGVPILNLSMSAPARHSFNTFNNKISGFYNAMIIHNTKGIVHWK